MGNKHKRKSKHRQKKRCTRSSSSSSTSSRSSQTPPPRSSQSRKRPKVSNANDAATVSTSNTVTLNNMIPDFDPLTDNITAWLNVIQSYATTFSWTDSTIRYQALNKLRGSAKVWYDSILRTEHT
jgi:hypothetical protein